MRSNHVRRRCVTITQMAAFGLFVALVLSGCPGDGGDFQGADPPELRNTTWAFSDGRAFRLPNQAVTLFIGNFGEGDLNRDEAPFTLMTNPTASGTLELEEGDFPFDSSGCVFAIETSDFDPETFPRLQPEERIPTNCFVSDDRTEFQLTNEDTEQVSTGTLQERQ
jgi:hypothetical protein